jgi:hypothetical protein
VLRQRVVWYTSMLGRKSSLQVTSLATHVPYRCFNNRYIHVSIASTHLSKTTGIACLPPAKWRLLHAQHHLRAGPHCSLGPGLVLLRGIHNCIPRLGVVTCSLPEHTRTHSHINTRTHPYTRAWRTCIHTHTHTHTHTQVAPPSTKDKVLGAKKEATRRNADAFHVVGVTRDELASRVVAFLGTTNGPSVFECSPFGECTVESKSGEPACVSHGTLDLSGAALEPVGRAAGSEGARSRKRKRGKQVSTGVKDRSVTAADMNEVKPVNVAAESRRALFSFGIRLICGGAEVCKGEDLPQSCGGTASWAVHVSFQGTAEGAGDNVQTGQARQAFWRFYDSMCGDILRTTRKWRRKEAQQ